eukprot:666519-Rhodomonas_salina.1
MEAARRWEYITCKDSTSARQFTEYPLQILVRQFVIASAELRSRTMRALPQSRLLVLPLVVISCVILHTITHSDPAALHTTNSLDGVLSSHQRTRGQRALLQDETTEGGGDTSGAGNHESGIKEPREGPGHQGPLRRGGRGGGMEGGPEAGPRGNPGGGTRGVPGGDPGVGPRGVPGGERGRNPFFPRKGGLGFSRDGMGPPGSFRNPGKAGPGWGKQGA